MAESDRLTLPSAGENAEQPELSFIAGTTVSLYNHFRKLKGVIFFFNFKV